MSHPRLARPRAIAVIAAAALAVTPLVAGCDTTSGGPVDAADASSTTPVGPSTPPDATATTQDTTTPTTAGLTLTRVEPARGSTTGLDEVQLYGSGFEDVVDVFFGDSPATEHFAVTDSLIVALAPPHPSGLVDVTVVAADGAVATLARAYTYRDDVVVTLVEPARGHWRGGDPITVHGAGFDEGTVVLIDGVAAPVVDVLDGETLSAVTPGGEPGSAELIVSAPGGVARYAPGFVYEGAPRVHIIAPSGGPVAGGYAVELIGEAFAAPATVQIGGKPLADVVVSGPTRLSGVVPAGDGPGPADVVVVTEAGAAVAEGAFHYLDGETQSLALLSAYPARGSVFGGDRVALAVTGLAPDVPVTVRFAGRDATVLSADAEAMTVVVETPAADAPGAASVSVLQGAAHSTLADAYTYQAAAHITAVEPPSGPASGGTAVVVRGAGFQPGATVRFGALPATDVQVIDDRTIEAITPPGSPGSATVRVAQSGTEATLPHAFFFEAPPAVWAVLPATGAKAGGTRVRIVGHGFPTGAQATVRFGGVAATDVRVVSDRELTATTPRGEVGTVAVSVEAAGVAATHPSGFTYFDPASNPGTWGGPVDGQLNITVMDARSGARVAGAAVVLGPTAFGPYVGQTDSDGQLTFSDVTLFGDQTVTAGRYGYQTKQIAGFDATNITIALDPVPTCADAGDVPCDQLTEPGPVAYFEGHIIGSTKGPTIPWGACADWPDGPEGLCAPCEGDDACGAGDRCGEVPGEGFFCTRDCAADDDCPGGFVCVDPTGAGQAGQCMAPPGEPATYCDVTEPDMWAEDALVYPGLRANDDHTIAMTTRLGDYAVYCWRGVIVRGEFRPDTLGITRGLSAYESGATVRADIRLDIPLDRAVTVEIDRPQMGRYGEARTTLRSLMNLGGDGVLELPLMRGFEARTYTLKLPALRGELANASWDFVVTVEVESLNGYSTAVEAGVRDIGHDLDLRLGEDGWALTKGFSDTTRGIADAHDGTVLVVGDGGRITKSFGDSHWAWQASGTTRDLHAVHVHDSGAAVAVGEAGVATHWDGFAWTPRDTGTVATLDGVWMSAADVAWAVGAADVLVYRDGAWSTAWTAPEALSGVWAPRDDDVWVVGDAGFVARFDGAAWSQVASGVSEDLSAIWGDSALGPIIVGAEGTVLRFDGAALVRDPTPTRRDLLAVWGPGDGSAWAVGRRGTVLAFDGEAWRDASNPDHAATLYAVGGAGGTVWAMGAHELVIGPMLGIPEDIEPMDGGYLWDRMSWSVEEDISPDYTVIDIGGAAGPCLICGMYFTIPYSEWMSVLDGDLFEASFPEMSMIGGAAVSFGPKDVALYRVKVDDGFDFDHTANSGFYNADWRAWAVRGLTYIR